MNPFEIFMDSLNQPIRIDTMVLAFSWSTIIWQFIIPLIFCFFLFMFLLRWSRTYINKLTIGEDRKQKIIRGLRIGVRVFYVILVLVFLSRFLADWLTRIIDDAVKVVRSPFYKSGATEISLLTLILAIPIFYIATLAGKASKLAFERSKVFTTNLSESRRHSIATLIRYVILAITLVVGLSVIGVDLSAIATILLVVGVGIGIGLQQVVASFFAGLVIVLNRPFKEGDFIQVGVNGVNHEGQVSQIRMLNSIIITVQNETIIMPNSHLLHNAVHNLSYHESHYQLVIDLVLDFAVDVEKAQQTLLAIAHRCTFWNGLGEPAAVIREFGPTGIAVQLRMQISSAIDRDSAISWINQEIYRDFRNQKIVFASLAGPVKPAK